MEKFENYNKSYINGQWVEGKSESIFEDVNPYDNSLITKVRLATREQVQEAFEIAQQAQKNGRNRLLKKERKLFEKQQNI